jgi:hypothetical protein
MKKGLDPHIFAADESWNERAVNWLAGQPNQFLDGNATALEKILTNPDSGVRMVVNITADALRSFLVQGKYLNAYGRPVVAGKKRDPSPLRLKVDERLKFESPEKIYFGAVALGGAGIRFYGDYCMVILLEKVTDETRVFDRNTYDLESEPLVSQVDGGNIVKSLRGTWKVDLLDLIKLKILPRLAVWNSLATAGTISDLLLHDEEFVEVHLEGTFTPHDVEEIREFPEDQVLESQITDRYRYGELPTTDQILWNSRRQAVRFDLQKAGLRSRLVAASGRGGRWK